MGWLDGHPTIYFKKILHPPLDELEELEELEDELELDPPQLLVEAAASEFELDEEVVNPPFPLLELELEPPELLELAAPPFPPFPLEAAPASLPELEAELEVP